MAGKIEVMAPAMIIVSAVPLRIASVEAQARDGPIPRYRCQGRNGWNSTGRWRRERSRVSLGHVEVNRGERSAHAMHPQYSAGLYSLVALRKFSAFTEFSRSGGLTVFWRSSSEDILRGIFSDFGTVQTCIVNVDKRHAFVKMITRRDAIAAKEGMERFKSADMQLRVRSFWPPKLAHDLHDLLIRLDSMGRRIWSP